jgi:hypothetical protein
MKNSEIYTNVNLILIENKSTFSTFDLYVYTWEENLITELTKKCLNLQGLGH